MCASDLPCLLSLTRLKSLPEAAGPRGVRACRTLSFQHGLFLFKNVSAHRYRPCQNSAHGEGDTQASGAPECLRSPRAEPSPEPHGLGILAPARPSTSAAFPCVRRGQQAAPGRLVVFKPAHTSGFSAKFTDSDVSVYNLDAAGEAALQPSLVKWGSPAARPQALPGCQPSTENVSAAVGRAGFGFPSCSLSMLTAWHWTTSAFQGESPLVQPLSKALSGAVAGAAWAPASEFIMIFSSVFSVLNVDML